MPASQTAAPAQASTPHHPIRGRCPRRPARRAQGGFLLWEVVIASGVFAIAITGLAVALNRLLDANTAAAAEQRLRTGLESQFATARVDPELEPGRTSTFKDADGTEYTRTVEEVEFDNGDKGPVQGFWKITIKARRAGEDLGGGDLLVYRQ